MTEAEVDAMLSRVFATPQGSELLDWMEAEWSVLAAPLIRQAIARQRERWSTGGPIQVVGEPPNMTAERIASAAAS